MTAYQSLDTIRSLIADELQQLDELIHRKLQSDVALINQMGHYIIAGGGKRIRPILLLLTAQALGYTGKHHITLAAVIEFIHTSTLLHDDVVDESNTRRGQDTANTIWGNAASVLVGDFLYSRSFQMMVEPEDMRVMALLADTTNQIAEGEVLQLLNTNNPDISEQDYFDVVDRKTGILFAASTALAGILAGLDDERVKALHQYGMHIGRAFQLIDDMLDYTGDAVTMGKEVGDDLKEGKMTYPLILAMRQLADEDKAKIQHAIQHASNDNIEHILALVKKTSAIEDCFAVAEKESRQSIHQLFVLADGAAKTALASLPDLIVSRCH